ncbi:MAG: SDR family oxidoreductase [Alphaproteobacteria bacterium]|nr:SDR family oxidoreductase [Alphaproteobacteria bacterium]
MGVLDGRVALITGGGRGIGRSIALSLARAGAKVVISSRTRAQLDSVVAEAIAAGAPAAMAVVADATKAQDQRGAVRAAIAAYGQLDILINNAGGVHVDQGVAELSSFSHTDDAFAANMDLNVSSAFWAMSEALPHMRERGYGRIINIGSGYSHHAGGFLVYVTAKHAIVGLTRGAAAEAAPHGINVNCLCPGWTNTSLVDFDFLAEASGSDAASVKAGLEAECLQKRILEPDEMGPMAVLLASEGSSAITGQVIRVDGGYRV